MKTLWMSLTIGGLLLAACAAPGANVTPTAAPTVAQPTRLAPADQLPTEVPQPMPTLSANVASVHLAAQRLLSEQLGLSPDQLTVVESVAVNWPDECLGLGGPGMMCAQVIVPGYKLTLEGNGQRHVMHTNSDGTKIMLVGVAGDAQAMQSALIKGLAQALGVSATQITVVSHTPVEWPDACLGVAMPNEMCAQMITPGHLIVLEANGRQYEYHTNATGSRVVPATLAYTWTREGGIAGFCDAVLVYASGEVRVADCKAAGGEGTLSTAQLQQLHQWQATWAMVEFTQKDEAVADAMTVMLTLEGQGAGQPTEDELKQLLEFGPSLLNTR